MESVHLDLTDTKGTFAFVLTSISISLETDTSCAEYLQTPFKKYACGTQRERGDTEGGQRCDCFRSKSLKLLGAWLVTVASVTIQPWKINKPCQQIKLHN